jgi:hypothetical protein
MNKKIILITALLFMGNTSFCMDTEGEGNALFTPPSTPEQTALPDSAPSAPPLSPQLSALSDRTRIDDSSTTNNNNPTATPEPGPLSNPNKASGARKRINIFTIAQTAAYEIAPKPVQMMCDQVEEHPKIAVLAALTAGECCGVWCCPSLTRALNLLVLGWGSRVVYNEFMAKEKEL